MPPHLYRDKTDGGAGRRDGRRRDDKPFAPARTAPTLSRRRKCSLSNGGEGKLPAPDPPPLLNRAGCGNRWKTQANDSGERAPRAPLLLVAGFAPEALHPLRWSQPHSKTLRTQENVCLSASAVALPVLLHPSTKKISLLILARVLAFTALVTGR